jgi:hypothetical protein
MPGPTGTEAPRLQDIDPATMTDVMSPDDVARLALENLPNGPAYILSDHYGGMFNQLLSMPRRDTLVAMAKAMKKVALRRISPI